MRCKVNAIQAKRIPCSAQPTVSLTEVNAIQGRSSSRFTTKCSPPSISVVRTVTVSLRFFAGGRCLHQQVAAKSACTYVHALQTWCMCMVNPSPGLMRPRLSSEVCSKVPLSPSGKAHSASTQLRPSLRTERPASASLVAPHNI